MSEQCFLCESLTFDGEKSSLVDRYVHMSFCYLDVSVQMLLLFEKRVTRVVCAFGDLFSRRVLV